MVNRLKAMRGLTLVEVLIGAALIAGVALVSASLISSQSTSSHFITAKNSATELGEQIAMVMDDPANCSCQLNPDLTADNGNDSALYWLLSTTDGSATLSVKRLRIGCAVNSPLLVQEGQNLTPDLRVQSIDFMDLRPTGTAGEWMGKFRVSFAAQSGRVPIAPLELSQIVAVAPGGPPGMARTMACKGTPVTGAGGGGGPIGDCGTLAMMGPPNGQGTYCIEQGLRPATDFFNAKTNCAASPLPGLPAGFGPGYICQHSDYYLACAAGVLDPRIRDQHFWLGNFDTQYDVTGYPSSAADCRGLSFNELRVGNTGPLVNLPYRCCWR